MYHLPMRMPELWCALASVFCSCTVPHTPYGNITIAFSICDISAPNTVAHLKVRVPRAREAWH